jgi:hypothetical protein
LVRATLEQIVTGLAEPFGVSTNVTVPAGVYPSAVLTVAVNVTD